MKTPTLPHTRKNFRHNINVNDLDISTSVTFQTIYVRSIPSVLPMVLPAVFTTKPIDYIPFSLTNTWSERRFTHPLIGSPISNKVFCFSNGRTKKKNLILLNETRDGIKLFLLCYYVASFAGPYFFYQGWDGDFFITYFFIFVINQLEKGSFFEFLLMAVIFIWIKG